MTSALKGITALFTGPPSIPAPQVIPPPPPPPNPPTLANPSSSEAGSVAARAAAAAAGGGFTQTLMTGPGGAATPSTAKQRLGD